MKAMRARAVLAAALLLTAAPAATHGGGLRVLGICSNRFDYTFSAVLDGRGGPPRMVFTDLYGPNGANEPRVVNGIRMPVFRTTSYSGSAPVYTR